MEGARFSTSMRATQAEPMYKVNSKANFCPDRKYTGLGDTASFDIFRVPPSSPGIGGGRGRRPQHNIIRSSCCYICSGAHIFCACAPLCPMSIASCVRGFPEGGGLEQGPHLSVPCAPHLEADVLWTVKQQQWLVEQFAQSKGCATLTQFREEQRSNIIINNNKRLLMDAPCMDQRREGRRGWSQMSSGVPDHAVSHSPAPTSTLPHNRAQPGGMPPHI